MLIAYKFNHSTFNYINDLILKENIFFILFLNLWNRVSISVYTSTVYRGLCTRGHVHVHSFVCVCLFAVKWTITLWFPQKVFIIRYNGPVLWTLVTLFIRYVTFTFQQQNFVEITKHWFLCRFLSWSVLRSVL